MSACARRCVRVRVRVSVLLSTFHPFPRSLPPSTSQMSTLPVKGVVAAEKIVLDKIIQSISDMKVTSVNHTYRYFLPSNATSRNSKKKPKGITLAMFKHTLRHVLLITLSNELVEGLFRKWDCDKDGVISMEDYAEAVSQIGVI